MALCMEERTRVQGNQHKHGFDIFGPIRLVQEVYDASQHLLGFSEIKCERISLKYLGQRRAGLSRDRESTSAKMGTRSLGYDALPESQVYGLLSLRPEFIIS